MAACAHFSPSAPETPIAPITCPLTTIGSAPGCGESCMEVGARFSPLRTILFVSEVARRQRKADLAFSRAVSIAFMGAPSMACDSMRLPPQSKTAIATVCLFCSAHALQASTKARAPALEINLISRVSGFCCAYAGAIANAIAAIIESFFMPSSCLIRFTSRIRLMFAIVAVIAAGGGQHQMRHVAACVHYKLDQSGFRFKDCLCLRNQRQSIHEQLPIHQAHRLGPREEQSGAPLPEFVSTNVLGQHSRA